MKTNLFSAGRAWGGVLLVALGVGCERNKAQGTSTPKEPPSVGPAVMVMTNEVTAPPVGVPVEAAVVAVVAPGAVSGATVVSEGSNEVAAPVVGAVGEAGVGARMGPVRPPLPSPVAEVVTMAEAGVGESVLLAFVERWEGTFGMGVEEIVYLSDVGIPEAVVVALVKKSGAQAESALAAVKEGTAVATALPSGAGAGGVPVVPSVPTAVLVPNAEAPVVVEAPVSSPAVSMQAAPEPAPVVNNYYYFQDALSPYGTWVELAPYGWCWQPTVAVVDTGWRPYAHGGRWIWTDCGWYWRSDYSWGWAPFHYGRWHWVAQRGWYWVPGSVWGPAWVSWRYTDAYCGWAPLPPEAYYSVGVGFTYRGARVGTGFDYGLAHHHYTFVDYHRFREHHPYRHAVGPDRRSTVYGNSTVINNYVVGNNNTVINRGVGVERVAAVTRTEVRKVSLQEVQPGAGRTVRPDTMTPDGKAMAVYRPDVRPRAVDAGRGVGPAPARQEAAKPVGEGAARPLVSTEGRSAVSVPLRPRPAGGAAPVSSSPSASSVGGEQGKRVEPNRVTGENTAAGRVAEERVGGGSTAGAQPAAVRRQEVRPASATAIPESSKALAAPPTPRPAPAPGVAPRTGVVAPVARPGGEVGSGAGSAVAPVNRLPSRPTPSVTTSPGSLREPRLPQAQPTPTVVTRPQPARQEAPKVEAPRSVPAVRSAPAPAVVPSAPPAGLETRPGGIDRVPSSQPPPSRVAPTPAPSRAAPTPAPATPAPNRPAPTPVPATGGGNRPGQPPEVN